MTVIIDYGMGNLASVYNACQKAGFKDTAISSSPDDVAAADKLILPGVGAFEDAVKNLEKFSLVKPIIDSIKSGKPFLGICLGMHLLFEKSHENGVFDGLGILKGSVVRLDVSLPVPHIGWNQVSLVKKEGIFDILEDNAYFYFDHAYYPVPSNKNIIATTTDYEITYASSIVNENIFAVQYHPEKSHRNGLKLLERFGNL
ncbi:MAG: imidazole glycerol phosphate synthase subunit HisH [Brevinematales bacterium]|jgi:glutamine amidotransferase